MLRFAVVSEASADFHIATELADRIIVESIGWMDHESLSSQREWISTTATGERLDWKSMRRLARDAGIRARGHFQDRPGEPDAAAARRAILFLSRLYPDLDGILLIRDRDRDVQRLEGLQQARQQSDNHQGVVIGLAIEERESWVICGFNPLNEAEERRLDQERNRVGFDPRMASHELNARHEENVPRSPKRVLRALTLGNLDRERQCWQVTQLDQLRARGQKNGLTAYLDEVRQRLAPLFGHVSTE